jgi:hypothetical protein
MADPLPPSHGPFGENNSAGAATRRLLAGNLYAYHHDNANSGLKAYEAQLTPTKWGQLPSTSRRLQGVRENVKQGDRPTTGRYSDLSEDGVPAILSTRTRPRSSAGQQGSDISSEKCAKSTQGGHVVDTPSVAMATDAGLSAVVAAWPTLPNHVRERLISIALGRQGSRATVKPT